MRGISRSERTIAEQLFSQGLPPRDVARKLNLPSSTINTWHAIYKKQKRISPDEIKKRLNDNSTYLNLAEAKILAAASKVVAPYISDDEWFRFQSILTKELQNLILNS